MWNALLNDDGQTNDTEVNAFLGSVLGFFERGRLLCLGENEATNAVYLATYGFDVVAVDPTITGIARLQQLAREHSVTIETHHVNFADFEFGIARFDTIVLLFCHIPQALRRIVHHRATLALKPGGLLILEGFRPEQLAIGPCGHDSLSLLMTRADILAELSTLDMIRVGEVERLLEEGPRRSGKAATLDIIARKRFVHIPLGPIN